MQRHMVETAVTNVFETTGLMLTNNLMKMRCKER